MFGYKHFLTTISNFQGYILLSTAFGGYILFLTVIYYFWRLDITFDVIYYFQLYFNVSLQESKTSLQFPTFVDLKPWFEVNINLLALIQFCFFCSSMVSTINLNLSFWKCRFTRNTQMLKMVNFLNLALKMVCKGNK